MCCWVEYSIQAIWHNCAFLHMLAWSSNICRLFDLLPGSRAVSLLLSGCLPSRAQTAESASNSTSALSSMPKPSAGSTMSGFHFIRVKKRPSVFSFSTSFSQFFLNRFNLLCFLVFQPFSVLDSTEFLVLAPGQLYYSSRKPL